jgi:rfaE bifunctional protein nucleotidyltransferase chain/domain
MTLYNKIISLSDYQNLVKKNVFANKKIVFTNGCFDILHSGHVLYLHEAKSNGDILVLGLNSDDSVKRLKGNDRPINNEFDRAIVLAALASVDYVIIFSQDTPYEMISAIKPDVLVKGGDWAVEDIVGHDVVVAKGGIVKSLMFSEGKSTTKIIQELKK